MEKQEDYWGYHFIADCLKGDIELVKSEENCKQFAKELVKRINMKAYGEPICVRFGQDHLAGLSLVQLIETSNITGHFCDGNGDFYLDIFSCKEFDPDEARKCIQQFYKPENIKSRFFIRKA